MRVIEEGAGSMSFKGPSHCAAILILGVVIAKTRRIRIYSNVRRSWNKRLVETVVMGL